MHALDAPQPKVSRHLSVLRAAGIVAQRRVAQWTFYRLVPLPEWAALVVRGAALALRDTAPHRADRARLAGAPDVAAADGIARAGGPAATRNERSMTA